jgi:hypothetical protein
MNIKNRTLATINGNKFQHVVNVVTTAPQIPHGAAAIRLGSVWF